MKLKILGLTCLLVGLFVTGFAQNFNRPIPSDFIGYEYQQHDNNLQSGYFMLTPFSRISVDTIYYVGLFDHQGHLVWYDKSELPFFDFNYNEAQNLLYYTAFNEWIGIWRNLFTPDFEPQNIFVEGANFEGDPHDFQFTADSNYLVLELRDTLVDFSGQTINGNPGQDSTIVRNFFINEYDRDTQELLFSWNAADHIPFSAFGDYFPYSPNNFDVYHPNSIAIDNNGDILVSMRHINGVYKISKATGDVIWRLGGEESDFTFLGDSGIHAQHDARILDNGNITVFDNHNFNPPFNSRAIEIELDFNDSTATVVDNYSHPDLVFAPTMGSYRVLPNGQRLIGWGNVGRPDPSMTLINSDQTISAELFLKDTFISYRATYGDFELDIERPVISCNETNGLVTLRAPMGYDTYKWSTGETTPAITVSTPGTYAVWVNASNGFIGSEPFVIDTLPFQCSPVGIETYLPFDQDEIISIFDGLGRSVQSPKQNHFYILHYKSGRSRKVIWSDQIHRR